MSTDLTHAEIETAVRDYVDGWFLGQPDRMERALHPGFAKRRIAPEMPGGLLETSALEMVENTERRLLPRFLAEHGLSYDPNSCEITIDHISDGVATARCLSPFYLDLLHLGETDAGWKIVNALWRRNETPEVDQLIEWMRRESPWEPSGRTDENP